LCKAEIHSANRSGLGTIHLSFKTSLNYGKQGKAYFPTNNRGGKQKEVSNTMTYNQKAERQALKIIEFLEPALMKKKGRYQTAWGNKTSQGLKASIFNILVELDLAYEKERDG
jgi:hypothetical protein